VRYRNRAFQLARQSGYAPARSTVTVCEWPDGRLAVEYRGRVMRWTEVTGRALIAASPAPMTPTAAAHAPAAVRIKPVTPAATHPWRRRFVENAPPIRQAAKT